jgi:hypothetical protein
MLRAHHRYYYLEKDYYNNGFRTAFIAYDDAFNFCLGDAGGTNDGISSSSLVKQLLLLHGIPNSSTCYWF